MKIYFCDGCNASIPLAEIQSGRVTTIKGKLFCPQCLPPRDEGEPATRAPARARTGLLWALVVVLLGWTLWRDLPELLGAGLGDDAPAAEDGAAAWERELQQLGAQLEATRAEAAERDRRLAFVQADLEEVRAATEGLDRSVDQWLAEVDRLGQSQVEAGRLIEKVEHSENRTDVLEERVDALADIVTGLQQELEVAVANAVAAAEQGAASDGGTVEGAPEIDPTRAAELESIRKQLLDPDAGVRFDAVDRIVRGRLDELGPELVAMLDDEDTFVRLHAMQGIGDLGYVEGVWPLLERLSDGSTVVRRTAKEQLVRLTGFDPDFDPSAGKGERERAIERWREWLVEHGYGEE